MKMKPVFLITLLAAGVQPIDAARKPAQVGEATQAADSDMKSLLKAIGSADADKVKEQLSASSDILKKGDGRYSPLGKAHHERRLIKRDTSLPEEEKKAKTKQLNRIIKHLEEGYDNSGGGRKASAKMKKAA